MPLPRSRKIRQFGLTEIQTATSNFHPTKIIHRGEYGITYKGILEDGRTVAVNCLDKDSNVVQEFRNECDILNKYQNDKYLVSLIGKCEESKEMILVHEFMVNGTLADHLAKNECPLSWMQLLKICLNVARGLEFLHSQTANTTRIIHRNLNPANIWLDENWAAKISEFGYAKIGPANQTHSTVSTDVRGSSAYLDPYYNLTGKLTRRTDTYAFGVILFEILCRRPAFDGELDQEQQMLGKWAQKCHKNGTLDKIIDTHLKGQASPNCLEEFAAVASSCLLDEPDHRLKMSQVVEKLDSILEKYYPSKQTRPSTRDRNLLTDRPKKETLLAVAAIDKGNEDCQSPKGARTQSGCFCFIL